MKIMLNRFFLLIAIVVGIIFINCINVNAEAVNKCDAKTVFDKYKPKADSDASNVTIKIVFNEDVNKTKYSTVVFTLDSVKYGNKFESEKKITEKIELSADPDKALTLTVDKVKEWTGGLDTVMLIFKKTAGDDPDCSGDISFTIKLVGLGRSSSSSGTTGKLDNDYSYGALHIDCSNDSSWAPKDYEFNKYFCAGKKAAESAGNSYDFSSDVSSTMAPLYCKKNDIYKDGELKKEEYYTNVNYYFGTSKTKSKEAIGHYKYHFSPGVVDESKTVDLYCEKTCDEEVEVYYGPPVVSRAGMCFQYNVKVISRTNCYPSGTIPAPMTYSVCTPYPYCTEPGWDGNAGGPNEDFDRCVKNCDGGKYTKKCSSKCYNSVYKKSNKMNSFNLNPFANKLSGNHGLQMGNEINSAILKCANNDYSAGVYRNGEKNYGCYYYDGSIIRWYGLEANLTYYGYQSIYRAPGRWYKTVSSWGIGTPYQVPYDEGFYREPHGGGSWCTDYCSWNGCSKGSSLYLNDYNRIKDEADNKAAFQKAKELCGASTSCTTTEETTVQTNFSMKVKINSDDNKNPYIKDGGDYIKINGDGVETSTKGYDSVIMENDSFDPESSRYGCYDSGASLYKNRYRAKIGFPGTWFNIKTGERSYVGHNTGSSSSWYVEDNKFCLPINYSITNESWLKFYLENIDKPVTERRKISAGSVPNPTYNILAKIENFGYYKWNFDVNCFFASDYVDGSGTKLRSVDLQNLFPNVGDPDNIVENTTDVVKEYPFNWSDKSITSKNDKYIINPIKLKDKIQKNSKTIYNDNNLEYEFSLSPGDISKLKDETNNYTLFKDGTYYKACKKDDVNCGPISPNGIPRYVSNVVTRYADRRLVVDTVTGKGVFCNNVKDATSGECEDFN